MKELYSFSTRNRAATGAREIIRKTIIYIFVHILYLYISVVETTKESEKLGKE